MKSSSGSGAAAGRWRRDRASEAEPPSGPGAAQVTVAAPRRSLRSWLLPLGVLAVALLWLLPLASRSGAARALTDDAIGNWVLLGIWLIWSASLAVVASSLQRAGRPLGRAWAVVQAALLVLVVVWALPPVLLGAPVPLEATASFAAHFVLPVVALALSALQGLLLFLRA